MRAVHYSASGPQFMALVINVNIDRSGLRLAVCFSCCGASILALRAVEQRSSQQVPVELQERVQQISVG